MTGLLRHHVASGEPAVLRVGELEIFRRNFAAIIRRLRKRREHTVIQSDGVPVAVLLPIAEYERLMAREFTPIDKIRDTLMESFGLWANRTDQPADSVEYVNEMRQGQRLDDIQNSFKAE